MMDDLDEIRAFRAEVPAPSKEARAHARAALDEAMGTPVVSTHHALERRSRRGGWLPRVAVISAAAAACAALLVLAVSRTGGGPAPAIAATLNRLARIAAGGPSLVPGPGQYLYVDSRSSYAAIGYGDKQQCITYAPDHSQVWIAANGSGMSEDTEGRTTFTSAADRRACAQMRLPAHTSAETSRMWFAADCFELGPTPDMQALSTDPRKLLVQMRRLDGGPRTAAEDFVHVGDFLRGTDASPALRAALYRAAALIPGVRLLGIVHDHIGRAGLGVALDAKGVHHELIFNPRTSALMGEEDHGGTSGSDDWAVYLQSRVVNAVPTHSPLPLTPACIAGAGHVRNVPGGSVITGFRADPASKSELGRKGGK